MNDRIVLWDRLYEAVLEMTGIPRSQLDMLLESPDPTVITEAISQLVVNRSLSDLFWRRRWEKAKEAAHAVPG